MKFNDRQEAGRMLSLRLQNYAEQKPLIFALARGGVPIGVEVAQRLQCELHVLVVRKIGAPLQPEFAVGALCEENDPVWNMSVLHRLGLKPEHVVSLVEAEKKHIREQVALFRQYRTLPSVMDRTVILVDDGLATGATMLAAVQYFRELGARTIVVGVPVASASSAMRVRKAVDELVAVVEPTEFKAVSQWYRNFSQVSDSEVLLLLSGEQELDFLAEGVELHGTLKTVPLTKALVVFAHGSGSSRKSPRNQWVARTLNQAGFGTFLFDLLTEKEAADRDNVFDVELLSHRLVAAVEYLREERGFSEVPIALFGASTGAAAAIRAASLIQQSSPVFALVSRGGRPDLAGEAALKSVKVPTLLIVGSDDLEVIRLNRWAKARLDHAELSMVSGAGHLFEERGALDEVARRAVEWFDHQLPLARSERVSFGTP